jgi:hypothetical protein
MRIRLPDPDVKNITVLTKNLPNEPVLPWHRFDSPWLEQQGQGQLDIETTDDTVSSDAAHGVDDGDAQLSLEVDPLSMEAQGGDSPQPEATCDQDFASN